MAALTRLRGTLDLFRASLVEAGFEIEDIPGPGAPSRYYAFWFALLAFLLQTSRQRNEPVPGRVRNAFQHFSEAFRQIVGLRLPALPADSTFSVLGMVSRVAATGAGGDCWCRHGDGTEVPMEVYRNFSVAPELEMTCSHGHTTTYETYGAANYLRKG